MNEKKIEMKVIVPVLLSFFVMSFCDLVGIGVDRAKLDFSLSNTLAQLIPSAVFLWFFIFSLPFSLLQDRISKRKVLNIGMIITAFGMLIPFVYYSFVSILIGFAFLGIGNTIVQVSANPLLCDVVPGSKRSSFLSFSQFIKSIGSMIAPPLAGWCASAFGDWKIIFVIFGIVSIVSVSWLWMTPVAETKNTEKHTTFGSSFRLLGIGVIAMMVIGIFVVVGIDVGINTISGQFLLNKFDCSQKFAESGRSFYFFGKMLGTFAGAIMLVKFSSRKFFFWSSVAGLFAILALMVAPSTTIAMIMIFIIGLCFSNIWPLIFSLAVEKYPLRSNEISGLMIMAISGGAVIPLLMGWVSDKAGLTAGIGVLILCTIYLIALSFICSRPVKENRE